MRVFTEDKIEIGRLDDIIFMVSSNPKVSKLVIKTGHGQQLILPFEYVQKINNSIIIKKAYMAGELEENELYIKKNLLDKQIIDIGGNKIVRVNDISLQEVFTPEKYDIAITGVDIGMLGILRRLGVESFAHQLLHLFGYHLTSQFLSWGDIQPLELTQGKVKLKKREEKLQDMRPEDLADYLEKTNEKNVHKFLRILDKKYAAEVIGNLNINYQRDLFLHWEADKTASILQLIHVDEAVDVLLAIPKKKREEILFLIPEQKRKELQHLMNLSRTPIGKIITSEYMTVSPTATVHEIMTKIKRDTADYSFFAAIYVLNSEKQLVGVFNPHDLLLQESETPVYKFMTQNLIEIRLTTPIEIAIRKMLRYHLPALPVVNNNKNMLGLLTFDQVAGFIQKKL
jgi:CBS domain-containing protein/sporulation protein YlmC with PRC-barrel domain